MKFKNQRIIYKENKQNTETVRPALLEGAPGQRRDPAGSQLTVAICQLPDKRAKRPFLQLPAASCRSSRGATSGRQVVSSLPVFLSSPCQDAVRVHGAHQRAKSPALERETPRSMMRRIEAIRQPDSQSWRGAGIRPGSKQPFLR